MIDWASGNVPVEHDYTHPERHFEGLVADSRRPDEVRIPLEWIKQGFRSNFDETVLLCWACGWTAEDQAGSYGPRIKMMHSRNNMGIWSIGTKWLILDQPNDPNMGADYMTWKFLKEQPGLTIPLLETMQRLSEPNDPIQFTLVPRAQGSTLHAVWHKLTPEQKDSYKDQMADILKQLRQFTAPYPQRVNGDELPDIVVGVCHGGHGPGCISLGRTREEWLENMADDLRFGIAVKCRTTDPDVIEPKLQELKDSFPAGEPYTLSHMDLNLTNIIVKDDKIEAIIDWEMAGYYPWWAEVYTLLHMRNAEHDFFSGPDGVWSRVHPDLAPLGPAFQAMFDRIGPVAKAFDRASLRAIHDVPADAPQVSFHRPVFCKCKPRGGLIQAKDLGAVLKHTAGDWRDALQHDARKLALVDRDLKEAAELKAWREENSSPPSPPRDSKSGNTD